VYFVEHSGIAPKGELIMPEICSIYRLFNPKEYTYYQCVEDHFERFRQVYDDGLASSLA
jgi:hypothetical protein